MQVHRGPLGDLLYPLYFKCNIGPSRIPGKCIGLFLASVAMYKRLVTERIKESFIEAALTGHKGTLRRGD